MFSVFADTRMFMVQFEGMYTIEEFVENAG